MIRVVVVEDQPLARERLVTLLRQEGVQVVGECADGAEALAIIPATAPDAVFLDVQMPEINGFDVIEALGVDGMPPVVFVTAFDQYALRAFEVHAFDYLLKPFARDRLAAVVRRLSKTLRAGRRPHAARYLDLFNEPQIAASRERVVLRAAGRIVFVRRDEIEWVTAEGNYCHVHAAGKDHLIRETMTDLALRLGPSFERIHRSTLINLLCVDELRTAGGGEYDVVLKNGVKLRVTRLHRPLLERRLQELE